MEAIRLQDDAPAPGAMGAAGAADEAQAHVLVANSAAEGTSVAPTGLLHAARLAAGASTQCNLDGCPVGLN